MSSSFFALNIAQSALAASQMMMDVASQNIANDQTPGYSRETANLAASAPYGMPDLGGSYLPGPMGTGVQVLSITRSRAAYLDGIYRTTASDAGLYSTRQNYLQAIQSLFGEPSSSGLSATMNRFFQDWQSLSQNPASQAARTTVQQDGEALASQIRSIWTGLQNVAQQATDQATADVQTANTYLQEIAQLNGSIANAQAVGEQPNGLMDKRDLLVDKLSRLMDIQTQTTTQTIGENTVTQVEVSVAGPAGPVTLVQGQKAGSLQVAGGPGGLTVTATDTSGTQTAVQPAKGSIGAAYGLVNVDTNPNAAGPPPSLAYQLNQVVQGLASSVNAQHAQGYYYDTATGTWKTGESFFVAQGGGAITAADIGVNPAIQQDVSTIAAGATPNPGDGQNATAIADIAQNPKGPLAQYGSFVAGMGSQVDLAQNLGDTAQALETQITHQREQVSGVSINEEMGTIVKAQAMYQAAAKVAQAADQMFQALVRAINP